MANDQARDSRGRFAGGAEAQTRNAGRHPVASHNGQQSVGTHVSPQNGTFDRYGVTPDSGFMVGGAKSSRYQGEWTDPATGKHYSEKSTRVNSAALAKSLGRQRNQISVYDLKGHREIATGGDGT